jgi:hypothetical protein
MLSGSCIGTRIKLQWTIDVCFLKLIEFRVNLCCVLKYEVKQIIETILWNLIEFQANLFSVLAYEHAKIQKHMFMLIYEYATFLSINSAGVQNWIF